MRILVTGGAGYIGSHTCLELLNSGHQVVVVDNLSNSSSEALKRVEQLTGRSITFYQADIRDEKALSAIFAAENVDAVIHFAGSKAVGESVAKPLFYYENNVSASGLLMQVMLQHQVKTLVFSSSATVYGEPVSSPIREDFAVHPESPYGRSKLMVEQIMSDLVVAQNDFSAIVLRYFNPVGAHESGLIGEDPNGIPNNLMPFINQVAIGRRPHLSVFGDDYDTPDGTGVRDYIHVCDLASGHVKALETLHQNAGFHVFNLGTGQGVSVLEMVDAYRRISGQLIAYQVAPRRPGDIACYYGDPSLAAEKLGWKAERGLDQMVADSWNWQKLNPNGYTRRS
ncbi:UDP-galactose-4-epimerase [Rheinheimera sp. KL1]|uniref:UDP-glucose 4-epimerase GalE n=1 Tax=Rheinheimera sp. KL1 TaxID=1635005 RepID=UPI0006A9FEBE|nr:UDP-glucose 4-epimerase GalE [Rheinheimera sp. KL1]KOO58406.1 UDP-galactose-4-epimerase [Rheinheimera sp. KL1]